MKSKEFDPLRPMSFSFICPEDREKEARELLEKIGNVNLLVDSRHAVKVFVDPDTNETTEVEGKEISGISFYSSIPEITRTLGEAGISAYSRATQIVVRDHQEVLKPN